MSTVPEFDLRESVPGTLAVTGALVFDNAAAVLARARPLLADGRQGCLDLAAVTRVDSAGMAAVLAMMAEAHRHGGHLQVLHAPASLVDLARVCEVTPLLAAA